MERGGEDQVQDADLDRVLAFARGPDRAQWPRRAVCAHRGQCGDAAGAVSDVVPAGAEHNIINISATQELKLYTIYSPPHHKDSIIRATKAEAEANEEDFDGVTTE